MGNNIGIQTGHRQSLEDTMANLPYSSLSLFLSLLLCVCVVLFCKKPLGFLVERCRYQDSKTSNISKGRNLAFARTWETLGNACCRDKESAQRKGLRERYQLKGTNDPQPAGEMQQSHASKFKGQTRDISKVLGRRQARNDSATGVRDGEGLRRRLTVLGCYCVQVWGW